MNRQIRVFLGLESGKPVGRWFAVVYLIGIGAVLYSVVTDWDHLHTGQRVAAIVKAGSIVLFGAVGIILNERLRRAEKAGPPA